MLQTHLKLYIFLSMAANILTQQLAVLPNRGAHSNERYINLKCSHESEWVFSNYDSGSAVGE